jgi:hypothetical protein
MRSFLSIAVCLFASASANAAAELTLPGVIRHGKPVAEGP